MFGGRPGRGGDRLLEPPGRVQVIAGPDDPDRGRGDLVVTAGRPRDLARWFRQDTCQLLKRSPAGACSPRMAGQEEGKLARMSLSLNAEVLAARYRLESLIASGGMGEVWRAVDLVLDRPVAVKLLRQEYAEHAETVARFRAEARHAAALSHPAIAQVYDYGEGSEEQPAFLVMELVGGPPLTQVIAGGPLEPARVLDLIAQVAAGLAVAHAAGVVHRDIKPGNLLLDRGGAVKITDFGVAYAVGSAPLTRTGTLIGTPAYLAPERVAGQAAGPASDLYSLGMVAYECLAGALPFTGTAVEIALAHRLQQLPPLPADVPPEVAGLITDLTARDPARRPAGADEVAVRALALRDAIGGRARAPAGTGSAGAGLPGAGGEAGGNGLPDITAEIPAAAAWQLAAADGRDPRLRPAARHRSLRAGPRGRALLIAAAIAVAASLAGWMIASLAGTASPRSHAPGSHSGRSAAPAVTVNAAALIGRPVSEVVRELRHSGLRVTVTWQPTHRGRPGTVISVRPSGKVLAGTTVLVTGASSAGNGPGGDHHDHGHGGDNGHGGDGNGDGNGQSGPG